MYPVGVGACPSPSPLRPPRNKRGAATRAAPRAAGRTAPRARAGGAARDVVRLRQWRRRPPPRRGTPRQRVCRRGPRLSTRATAGPAALPPAAGARTASPLSPAAPRCGLREARRRPGSRRRPSTPAVRRATSGARCRWRRSASARGALCGSHCYAACRGRRCRRALPLRCRRHETCCLGRREGVATAASPHWRWCSGPSTRRRWLQRRPCGEWA
mmetsp:Transcript_15149/g.50290  ORF Transcript_15149/g.50290 Transcript_15149/m.50290 type:complete len:215 (+) Transcript_15149:248-892(+)